MRYTVRYYAGPYSGKRTVHAEDSDEAIDKVRRMIRSDMTLPNYSDGYKIVDSEDDENEEDED